ncbi:unnamed protein product [Auanema sp. JU1783]|nr:unnamed protein product [Auanema sp. JU1783]
MRDETAEEEYNNLDSEIKNQGPWETLVKELCDKVCPPHRQSNELLELQNIRQGELTIDAYVQKLRRKATAAFTGNDPLKEKILKSTFLRGLNKKIRKDVIRSEPTTFTEAIIKAQKEEALWAESNDDLLINAVQQALKTISLDRDEEEIERRAFERGVQYEKNCGREEAMNDSFVNYTQHHNGRRPFYSNHGRNEYPQRTGQQYPQRRYYDQRREPYRNEQRNPFNSRRTDFQRSRSRPGDNRRGRDFSRPEPHVRLIKWKTIVGIEIPGEPLQCKTIVGLRPLYNFLKSIDKGKLGFDTFMLLSDTLMMWENSVQPKLQSVYGTRSASPIEDNAKCNLCLTDRPKTTPVDRDYFASVNHVVVDYHFQHQYIPPVHPLYDVRFITDFDHDTEKLEYLMILSKMKFHKFSILPEAFLERNEFLIDLFERMQSLAEITKDFVQRKVLERYKYLPLFFYEDDMNLENKCVVDFMHLAIIVKYYHLLQRYPPHLRENVLSKRDNMLQGVAKKKRNNNSGRGLVFYEWFLTLMKRYTTHNEKIRNDEHNSKKKCPLPAFLPFIGIERNAEFFAALTGYGIRHNAVSDTSSTTTESSVEQSDCETEGSEVVDTFEYSAPSDFILDTSEHESHRNDLRASLENYKARDEIFRVQIQKTLDDLEPSHNFLVEKLKLFTMDPDSFTTPADRSGMNSIHAHVHISDPPSRIMERAEKPVTERPPILKKYLRSCQDSFVQKYAERLALVYRLRKEQEEKEQAKTGEEGGEFEEREIQ